MNRLPFRFPPIAIIGLWVASSTWGLVAASSVRPNILFIMSDDHTSQAFGVYGSRLAHLDPTPTLDRLAREGRVFDNVFCTNSICTPSRATILTGQFSQANGVLDLGGSLPASRQYLATEMKRAGYETAMIGKWHLKEEPAAFDFYKVLPGQGAYFDPKFRVRSDQPWPGNEVQDEGHSSDVITDSTLHWLKTRDDEKPFFLMHHFKAPHGKWDNAPRYDEYLSDIDVPEPASLFHQPHFGSAATVGEEGAQRKRIGSSLSRRNANNHMLMRLKQTRHFKVDPSLEAMTGDEFTHEIYQVYLKRYLRCVRGIDDNVKRLLDHLETTGQLDNTLIIYTSDQGMLLGEHDYIDKRWMYEESLRMPFIVRYPRTVSAGTRSDAIINNADFAPTLLDLVGQPTPEYMQGRSFKSILETGAEPSDWPQSTYYRYWMHMMHHANPGHFGIRTKDYKLIFFYGASPTGEKQTPPAWELYDMKADPEELHNLYGKSDYAEITADLKTQLISHRERLNETDESYPEIQEIIDAHWN